TFLIFSSKLTIGQMLALQFYSFFIFGPLQELGNIINTYREAEASLNNFEGIMNTPKDPKPAKPVTINKINSLEFKNVTFKHQSAKTYALDNISFKTEIGKTIAFAGLSCSGKTTLVKLLVGLYQPAQGEILYNGNS